MLKLKINVILPQLLCLAFLQLKMANLSDLMGFALTVAARFEETRVESSFSTAPAPSRFLPKN